MDQEPTHHLSRPLQQKLVEAKRWRDQRQKLIDDGYTAPAAWSDNVSTGVLLLDEIIDVMDQEWGFAK